MKLPSSNPECTLGVVAICYNEERDLPGFLDNVTSWVDEVVIVDDGSTDRTNDMLHAASEKTLFLQSPRMEGEYYANQRNKGIDVARSDWLLHMDIDERVSPELAAEILTAISQPGIDAYRLHRLNYFLHRPMRGGGWTDWNQVHLARRECLRFSGMFHERAELLISDTNVGQLQNYMYHLNDESYKERLEKSSRYQVEVSETIKQEKLSVGYFDILGAFVLQFAYTYFWKLGLLDGIPGLIWAFHTASARVRAYTLVWDELNRIPREEVESKIRLLWEDYKSSN